MLGQAVDALARKARLAYRAEPPITPSLPEGCDAVLLEPWIAGMAAYLGIDGEPVYLSGDELDQLAESNVPALLLVPGDKPRFLALQGGNRKNAVVVGRDLASYDLPLNSLHSAINNDAAPALASEMEDAMTAAGIGARRRQRICAYLQNQQFTHTSVVHAWILRRAPGESIWRQLLPQGALRQSLGLLGFYSIEYALWLLSWWVLGKALFEGHLDPGWLKAWILLLLTIIPFQLLTTRSQGLLAITVGDVIKNQLLYGTLRLEADRLRAEGTGQLLGRVIESESIESLSLTGGFLSVMALVEMTGAFIVLSYGAGGRLHLFLLASWIAASAAMAWRHFRLRRRWTDVRLGLTHGLVETMVGHRTRLAQEPPERWHRGEDRALQEYSQVSLQMDRAETLMRALIPRGWLLLGVLGLAPAFVAGGASSEAMALALGGVLLAFRALQKFGRGITQLFGAALAWNQVAPIFRAAARGRTTSARTLVPSVATGKRHSATSTILQAEDVEFRYPNRSKPVLRGFEFCIRSGDRIILEGPSGAGKSTLVALLASLRVPQSGLMLLHGLDRHTLGAAEWRRRVVAVPQFHENYVVCETFGFNLLMGLVWSPRPSDLLKAEGICRELGLGDLLDRMPAGLFQMVGDSGWQLSHGERSRLFIARALLQEPEVLILDETFAALDPENLHKAVNCMLRHAPTLVLVAHP